MSEDAIDGRAFFQRFFDRLWVERDPSAATDYRAPQLLSFGLAHTGLDADPYRAFYDHVIAAFATTRVEITHCVQSGEEVALKLAFHGKTRGGRVVEFRGMAFARLRDGKIIEADNLFDVAGLLGAMGGTFAPVAATLDGAVVAIAHVEKAPR